ncbi:unnamed protein product [Prorocentrum cordatum]|uniref:Uncharacterized protein n=1 Tax=Prorocentrum cordatum TaxID=2364126 RepID=A0ABN9RVJ5_9DINO|nr:unnamed protein product [Polarella glacialis]
MGVDEGDGWLKVGNLYLPFIANNCPVLVLDAQDVREDLEALVASAPELAEVPSTQLDALTMADDGGPLSRTPSESSEAPTSAGEASDTGGLCARAPTAAQVWDYPLSQPEKHRRLELLLDGEARLATEALEGLLAEFGDVSLGESSF